MSILMLLVLQLIVINTAQGSSIEGIAQGKVSNLHGTLGESIMDDYFKLQGWEKLQGEVGRNGFDGLFVQRSKDGTINKVLISESKFGNADLGSACKEQQMTFAWTMCKLEALEKNNEKNISVLEKKINAGKATAGERSHLIQLKKEKKDLQQIRKHIEAGHFRSRIFRTKVTNGELHIFIHDVDEVNGQVIETTPDLRAKIESGKAIEDIKNARIENKPTRVISLKYPPVEGDDLKVYDTYFKNIESELQNSGMSKKEAENAVQKLKFAFKDGTVTASSGKNGQAAFLRERLIPSLDRQIANETKFVVRHALEARRAMLITSAKMEGFIDANALFQGMNRFKSKTIQRLYSTRPVKYVRGILTQNGKLLISVPKSVGAGLGAGLLLVSFDSSGAYMDFTRGQILRPEFERNLADAAAKGGVVGLGTGVAVMLGASPIGMVVIGIGVGGYIITDLLITKWHRMRERKYLSSEDLAVFGLTMKNTIPLRMDKWNPDIPLNMENWR